MQNCWQQMAAMMINWSLHNKLPSNLFPLGKERNNNDYAQAINLGPHREDRHSAHISMSEAKKNTKLALIWPFFSERSEEMGQQRPTNAQKVEILTLASTPKVILGTSCFVPLNSTCWDILVQLAAH